MLSCRFKSYWSDPWNRVDQVMYIMLLVAVILRFTLTNDNDFMWARYVYTVDLVLFYIRILQLYYIHEHLGPKVLVIWRMVCVILLMINVKYVNIYINCRFLYKVKLPPLVPRV